ncbi:MAG: preprotein translocase subunit SecE [Anaerolineales bacterium]|nr:preprotein translocase subunit SecE [Anaerolineales bacterium]MCS7249227.1 preprotein translocase subunit SecE [Anaerolineales bacterium]MDW8163041.1 preprotein translocase subunit SecE [Anaerolineales bacterium]MDW8448214.1 preprotein translocase subunit SecE [Anaerolineales bacterium]
MAKAEKSIVRRQPNAIVRYLRETSGELKKVNWPTRREALNLTVIVLVVTLVMSILMGFLDLIFSRLFALIFQIGS